MGNRACSCFGHECDESNERPVVAHSPIPLQADSAATEKVSVEAAGTTSAEKAAAEKAAAEKAAAEKADAEKAAAEKAAAEKAAAEQVEIGKLTAILAAAEKSAAEKAERKVMPTTVIQFSGCNNKQTSADVSNTTDFGIHGPGGAGGACTCSLLKALEANPTPSWSGLLSDMRRILQQDGYKQIPQLCCNRELDLNQPMTMLHWDPKGRCRSVLVGINYVGSEAELSGCQSDVARMQQMITKLGFTHDDQMVLMDDGVHEMPTHANIGRAMSWLVEGANEGDSLFFHYSGHGVRMKDQSGDEPDGFDEALAPVDYSTAGFLLDDEAHNLLVKPLGTGVSLLCIMDCCHSGTILDLPYRFVAHQNAWKDVASGKLIMQPKAATMKAFAAEQLQAGEAS